MIPTTATANAAVGRSHRLIPEVEPGLVPALLLLPETQRAAVWLVHACQWRYAEVAEALGTTTSTVGNHVSRALERLRHQLEVDAHD